jgi:hypothetical protein
MRNAGIRISPARHRVDIAGDQRSQYQQRKPDVEVFGNDAAVKKNGIHVCI